MPDPSPTAASSPTRRRALVTGASAGLGAEFARQYAQRGLDLLLVARRESRLREQAEELQKEYGIDVAIFPADLADRRAPAEIEAFATESRLTVDVLVNNAGSAGPDLVADRDWEEQAAFIELMMVSVAQMCHRFIPGMVERNYGRVINVASFAGRLARPAGANYGPSKAYLIALSEELDLQLKGTQVHVSALCPGFVHTEFHAVAGLDEMKAGLPKFLWYDAETVVREGIEAAERGRAVMVSGRLYRFLDPIAQSVFTRPIVKAFAPGR